jgi:hypothetical protein
MRRQWACKRRGSKDTKYAKEEDQKTQLVQRDEKKMSMQKKGIKRHQVCKRRGSKDPISSNGFSLFF